MDRVLAVLALFSLAYVVRIHWWDLSVDPRGAPRMFSDVWSSTVQADVGRLVRAVDDVGRWNRSFCVGAAWENAFREPPAPGARRTTADWIGRLRACLQTRTIFVKRQSLPYVDPEAIAYVLKWTRHMWLLPKYFELAAELRGFVLVHECTHLVERSEDRAYRHQVVSYAALRGAAARRNADSLATFLNELLFACPSSLDNGLLTRDGLLTRAHSTASTTRTSSRLLNVPSRAGHEEPEFAHTSPDPCPLVPGPC